MERDILTGNIETSLGVLKFTNAAKIHIKAAIKYTIAIGLFFFINNPP